MEQQNAFGKLFIMHVLNYYVEMAELSEEILLQIEDYTYYGEEHCKKAIS